ncbi:MetS family NSS transporter small subunit [candidate division KSB1 bacterium]
MNISALIMLILICGLVWGGFIFAISIALKREKGKSE